MLVQLPRGSADQPKGQNPGECTDFEAALRRDLASAPVVAYGAMLGGPAKRALDLAIVVLGAPVWAPLMLGAALWSKLRHPAPVFRASERIGYGGRTFRRFDLRIAPPSAVIERLRPVDEPAPANDLEEIASRAEASGARWRRVFERLPQMFNVLRGDMSLVGPAPLTSEELEPLKISKRYYLSARPGIVGINSIADADEEDAGHYKLYNLTWSLGTDVLIIWDALRSLRQRGTLWQPSLKLKRTRPTPAATRRRRAPAG